MEKYFSGTDLVTNTEIISFCSIRHTFKHSMTKSLPKTSFSFQSFRSAEFLYSQAEQISQEATEAVGTTDLAT